MSLRRRGILGGCWGRMLGREMGKRRKYVVESLTGFDLFPQTAHVEGVAVLRLKDVEE